MNFRNYKSLFILICFSVSFNSWSQIESKTEELIQLQQKEQKLKKEIEILKLQACQDSLKLIGYPTGKNEVEILEHSAMVIGYSCQEKLPAWVFHVVTPDILTGNVSRTNNFRADPKASCTVCTHQDYSKTILVDGKKKSENYGYDQGHLAPAGDFNWSKTAMSESFYYSNMTAQRPDFNRNSWNNLENKVRKSLEGTPCNYYVVTGPVLNNYSGVTGGPNEIPVPNYFYKAIIRLGKKPSGIGFIMPNEKCEKNLMSYVVTIDSIEKLTGLDLFPSVEKKLQTKIEAQKNFNNWNFVINKNDVSPMDSTKLAKNVFNSDQAKNKIGETVQIVGKVVSVKYIEESGTTLLNLDKSFPNQTFTIVIWKDDLKNFSYTPHLELEGKTIIITGKVILGKENIPSMNIKSEKQIQLYEGK